MACIFCKYLCDRFCPPEARPGEIWRLSHKWEEYHSNEWELWDAQSVELKEDCEKAVALFNGNASDGFVSLDSLGRRGSSFAARTAGWHYESGDRVAADLERAAYYYAQATNVGSSMASIDLARVLRRQGGHGDWQTILEDAMQRGFAPAGFWLGWYRYADDRTSRVAMKNAPLIDDAALAGHPGARLTIARWKSRGMLGWRQIPSGFRGFAGLYRDAQSGQLNPYGDEEADTGKKSN